MEIIETREDDVAIVHLNGMLDHFTTPDVEQRILNRIDAGEKRLLLDLADLSYLSSVGMGLLVKMNRRAHEAGGRMVLCSLQSGVLQLLQACGLVQKLDIKKNREEALAYLLPA